MLINYTTLPGFAPIHSATPSFNDFSKAFNSPEPPLPGLKTFDREFNSFDQPSTQATGAGPDFSKMLDNAINQVDAQDQKARTVALDMALGQDIDPHKVMIEYAKASTMIHLASGISTKMAQDFTTLMNMQI